MSSLCFCMFCNSADAFLPSAVFTIAVCKLIVPTFKGGDAPELLTGDETAAISAITPIFERPHVRFVISPSMTSATLDNELRIGTRPRLFLAERDRHLPMKKAESTCGHQNVDVLGQRHPEQLSSPGSGFALHFIRRRNRSFGMVNSAFPQCWQTSSSGKTKTWGLSICGR